MEKISIIIPLHNPPLAQFRLCLESVSKQIYDNYEVILVDDGSDDETYKDVISEYKNIIPNLRIIIQKNQGVSAARNTGIRAASGKFIAFCDCDDFLSDCYLYSLQEAIYNVDLAVCGITEQFYPTINSLVDMKIFASFPSVYNYVQYVNFCHNKLYKKSIITDNDIFFDEDIKLGEDSVFLADYFSKCRRIRTIDNSLYHYLSNNGSAVHTYYPEFWEWESKVIRCQLRTFGKYPLNFKEQQFMQHWLFDKIRGVVNYYVDLGHVNVNSQEREKIADKIMKSDIYKKLMENSEYKSNMFFNAKDRKVLWIWHHLGLEYGIKLKKYMKLTAKFIH